MTAFVGGAPALYPKYSFCPRYASLIYHISRIMQVINRQSYRRACHTNTTLLNCAASSRKEVRSVPPIETYTGTGSPAQIERLVDFADVRL